ncbi:hypothetical protein EYC80_009722 [Monilinia laxa]|uniref:Uncharacterized protein n=1 Tax=Monilinia laxa TaxID=61186 RepID=A0A5N6JYT6_MONLA|nr:hypothetical protein EYC80_009722 [Monilinia laxa]
MKTQPFFELIKMKLQTRIQLQCSNKRFLDCSIQFTSSITPTSQSEPSDSLGLGQLFSGHDSAARRRTKPIYQPEKSDHLQKQPI